MIQIRVCYRAIFQQPIGVLNPGAFKLPSPVDVEVFQKGKSWYARAPQSRHVFESITPQATAGTALQQMKLYFEKQLTPWEKYNAEGQKLDPSQIVTRPNGTTWLKGLQDSHVKTG